MLLRSLKRFALKLEQPKWFVMAALLFRALLEIAYRGFVNPIFEHAGFLLNFDILKYIESWIIYCILIYFSPKMLIKPSDYLIAYMLFSFLAPLLVYYSLANAARDHLYIVLFAVSMVYIFKTGKLFEIPFVRFGGVIAVAILGLGSLGVTIWMMMSGGLNYFNLDLMRVYEFREDSGAAINVGIMSYINSWAMKVFGPLALAIALWQRRYLIAAFVIGLHLLWFGISAHKAVIFYPFLIIFLWAWFRNSRALSLIALGMSLVIFLSFLLYIYTLDITAGDLLVRRVFFVPSLLTFSYYDFFSVNHFTYWSQSFTSFFIKYPYDIGAARLIGQHIGIDAHANNSFFSTGYMHAGVPGVILYGILVGFLFRIIDSLGNKGIPPWVAVASVLVPSQALITSADLPTALLTHGFGMSILLLFLLRSKFNKLN